MEVKEILVSELKKWDAKIKKTNLRKPFPWEIDYMYFFKLALPFSN